MNFYCFSRTQSIACRKCGKCCGLWEIPVLPSELPRLKALELPELEIPVFRCFPKNHLLKRNGKCVFSGPDGLCLIHKKYGFDAKPLACRMYPLDVRVWEDSSVSASPRYDCPAVAFGTENDIAASISLIAQLGVESGQRRIQTDPGYRRGLFLGIPRMREIAEAYSAILTDSKLKLPVRFYAAASLLRFHEDPDHAEDLRDAENFREDAVALAERSGEMLSPVIDGALKPGKDTLAGFRFLIASMLRDDAGRNLFRRISATWNTWQFMRGRASLICRRYVFSPDILPGQPVTDPEVMEPCFRWLDSKLKSLNFCGGEMAELTFTDGMHFLLLAFPVIFSLASQMTEKGQPVDRQKVSEALQVFDHSFLRTGLYRNRPLLIMAEKLVHGDDYPGLLKFTMGTCGIG